MRSWEFVKNFSNFTYHNVVSSVPIIYIGVICFVQKKEMEQLWTPLDGPRTVYVFIVSL